MPKITAHSKIFRDWEGLLGACAQNTALLPGMEALTTELERFLAQGKEMKIQQEALTAQRTAMTQRLVELEVAGDEAARKLRAFVFSHLGSRTEALKQFGMVPKVRQTRKPPKKKAKPPAVKPPATPLAEPAAAAAQHSTTPAETAAPDHNG